LVLGVHSIFGVFLWLEDNLGDITGSVVLVRLRLIGGRLRGIVGSLRVRLLFGLMVLLIR
jgi:hypothetical protein